MTSEERVMAVRAARYEVRRAEQAMAHVVRGMYPAGATVYWEHGENPRSARVLDHSGARLRVESPVGARYWIGAEWISGVRVSDEEAEAG